MANLSTFGDAGEDLLQLFIGHEDNAHTGHDFVIFGQDPPIQAKPTFLPDYMPQGPDQTCSVNLCSTTSSFQLHSPSHEIQGICHWTKIYIRGLELQITLSCLNYNSHQADDSTSVSHKHGIIIVKTSVSTNLIMAIHKIRSAFSIKLQHQLA